MRDMLKPSLSLLVICFAVGLSLSVINYFTKSTIAERSRAEAEAQRKEVLPLSEKFDEKKGWEVKTADSEVIKEAYKGITAGKTSGYVFVAAPKGYGGEIRVTVGVGSDGKVTGVKIGDNKETPGLGTKAAEPKFIDQFKGKKSENKFNVVKKKPAADNEIEAVSGATISSRAVTSAVQAAGNLASALIKEEGGK